MIATDTSAEPLAAQRRTRARKGTVCPHCWLFWRQGPAHDTAKCRDVWRDSSSPNGLTVCMCGCRSKQAQSTADEGAST